MSNKEKEMTNKVVDASSPPDTQGAVMNDSPANTTTDNTTTDNSDATDISATEEEDSPSNDDAPSNNQTNDKEVGEPTLADGTPQPQPQIEEAPPSPIKQLINKFNQSQQSNNNNNDSTQSAAAVADVADEVGEEEDVENLTEDEYDQLDNDNDIAMDVVIEEEVEDEEIEEEIEEEGIAKDQVVEGETDNSIAVQTAAVQNEVVDLQDLDANNEDLTAANNEEEEIKVAVAEVEDTEEVIKDDFVENTNVQEEAELSPLTQADIETLVAAEEVDDSKTTEIMPVPMEMTSYADDEEAAVNTAAANSSPVIIEEATPLSNSPTKDNENEITRSEFIRSIFIKRMQESSSNDQLEKQQTNNGVNYCNGNNNIESQPPSPTEMYSAGSQQSRG